MKNGSNVIITKYNFFIGQLFSPKLLDYCKNMSILGYIHILILLEQIACKQKRTTVFKACLGICHLSCWPIVHWYVAYLSGPSGNAQCLKMLDL
jgi:hypothetical protein